MKHEDSEKSVQRLREAIDQMPDDERESLLAQAEAAHQYLLAVRSGTVDPGQEIPPRELFLVHSALNGDPDGLLAEATSPSGDGEGIVLSDGSVYNGNVQYDLSDQGWFYCTTAWTETMGQEPPFSDNPAVIRIEDDVNIVVVGDWGGNNQAARDVAADMKDSFSYYVHLGDVYYAGTAIPPDHDYQRENFLDVWPEPNGKSFTLNANHDMYAHGAGYFNVVLASEKFAAQNGCSYFALYNNTTRVVGLDTAYFATDHFSGTGFMNGALNDSQQQFLHQQAQAAAGSGQQLVVLSHHGGLTLNGETQKDLWTQVTDQLSPLSGLTVTWYWGHEHAGVVYAPRPAGGVTIHPRCCGHGCIPWGLASELEAGTQAGDVLWYENTVIGPQDNYFVSNGYAWFGTMNPLYEMFRGRNAAGEWAEHWDSEGYRSS